MSATCNPTRRGWRSRSLSAALAIAWSTALVFGLAGLVRYQGRTGVAASAPARWPSVDGLALSRAADGCTLLVFAHPKCPCTRATIGELDRIVARSGPKLHAAVILLSLPELGLEWSNGDLREAAERIPGVEVIVDEDGALARRFGVETSGQALLYDAGGDLVFQGGITAARGHSGDNAGASAIVARALGESPECDSAPVYGCCLFRAPKPNGAIPASQP